MALRRGFKAQAERLSLTERRALDLTPTDRLDPRVLAGKHGVLVLNLEALRTVVPDEVEHLTSVDPDCFSAAMIVREKKRLVVLNETHPAGRQANSLAHELAHYLLDHPAGAAFDDLGNRGWTEDHEDEANYLAGALLAPRDGLIPAMRRLDQDLDAAAEHFGISRQLMSQRWHQTGCAKQAERARASRGR